MTEKLTVIQKSDRFVTVQVDIDGIYFNVDVITRNGAFLVATSVDNDEVTMRQDHIRIDSRLNRAEISPLVK